MKTRFIIFSPGIIKLITLYFSALQPFFFCFLVCSYGQPVNKDQWQNKEHNYKEYIRLQLKRIKKCFQNHQL